MHTVAAPSRHISPVRSSRPSPLNPTRPRAAAAPALTRPPPSSATNSKTHLANLDRLLQKPSPTPPPLPPLPEDHGAWVDMDGGSRWGTLNALSLSGVLPAARKVEEMSPRSLNQLQRLLNGTPRPSPRNGIAGRWRELHGAKDWERLLDPLDEDLRREIVRNGDFVQAAYHAFHSNPAKQPSDRRQVALPDRSYRVTRDLYATSSIEMPRLVDGVAPWMRQKTSWVGYVAVCDSEREIQRMGRRDIVIALRGTATALEWAENFRAALVKVPHADAAGPTATEATEESREPPSEEHVEPKVECGFWSLFTTESKQARSLRDTVVEEVRRLMEVYKGEQLSITVTGHSLGAALAVLVADELGASLGLGMSPPIAVFSFGSPHVGNRGFAERVRDRGVKVLRVVNKRDVITRVPGVFADYQKVAEEDPGGGEARRRWLRAAAEGGKLGRLPDRWRDAVERAMTAWSYTHVGSELRLDSRQSPFLKPDAGPGCCHDLEAYLHLVDGFLSSRCPFRANAKRSIVKLMAHEGSSLKRHYTSRALALIGMEAAAAADAEAVPAADGGGGSCVPSPTSS